MKQTRWKWWAVDRIRWGRWNSTNEPNSDLMHKVSRHKHNFVMVKIVKSCLLFHSFSWIFYFGCQFFMSFYLRIFLLMFCRFFIRHTTLTTHIQHWHLYITMSISLLLLNRFSPLIHTMVCGILYECENVAWFVNHILNAFRCYSTFQ